jgi:hypothetical protein
VPWETFRADIEAVVLTPEEMRKSSAGRKPLDAIAMFRMLVLQATIFRTSRRSIRCVTGCHSRDFCSWRARIKRLLELDRSLGRKLRSKDAEQANFSFFSEEAPGTGADILFSEYEAFALLNGLRIMGRVGRTASQLQSCAAFAPISKGSTRADPHARSGRRTLQRRCLLSIHELLTFLQKYLRQRRPS